MTVEATRQNKISWVFRFGFFVRLDSTLGAERFKYSKIIKELYPYVLPFISAAISNDARRIKRQRFFNFSLDIF